MSAAGGGGGDLALGSEFAGHRLESVLGRGGMGIVYRALHLALDRPRALKVVAPALSADERFRERFRRESRLAASIEHPNVIPVHEAGESDGQLYISMRLVEGTDLRELVTAGGALGEGSAVEVVSALGSALDAAHGAGLIHRDVKPANVLVGAGADDGRIFLTDFGISRTADGGETVTRSGELLGTAGFVAPEQIAGDPVDHRADLYALGAVAYYALTGEPPFVRESELATLFAHASAPRPRATERREDLAAGVDAVLARSLAVAPEDRYGSGAELAEALATALAGGETAPLPSGRRRGEPATPRDRRPWGLIGIGAGVLAAVALALVLLLGGDEDPVDGRAGGNGGRPAVPQPRAAAPIEVGAGPSGLTVGDLKVWVAANAGNEVNGIELTTSTVDKPPIEVPEPVAVAVGHGSIWAISDADDALYRLDPAEGVEPLRIPLPEGGKPSDIAVDADWVWVADEGAGTVSRFDPAAPSAAPVVEELVPGLRAIAAGLGEIWVVNVEQSTVSRIDPGNGRRIGSPIELPAGRPSDIAVGEGAVWVSDNLNGTAIELDPEAGAPAGEPFTVGDLPRGIKAGLGYVWVALGGEDAVARIDPSSHEPVGDPTPVGDDPADIALGTDSVWTANQQDSTVTRIDP